MRDARWRESLWYGLYYLLLLGWIIIALLVLHKNSNGAEPTEDLRLPNKDRQASAENIGTHWKKISADPYTLGPKPALQAMTKYGLPDSAIPEIERRIGNQLFVPGVISKGEQCRVMVYGRGKTMAPVFMAWEDAVALNTEDYEVGNFVVRRVVTCNNWLLCEKKTTPAPAERIIPPTPHAELPAPHAVAAAPPPLIAVGSSKTEHLMRIRVWDGGAARQLAAVEGQQSRDLGAKLRELARKGELKTLNGCNMFSIAFENIDFAAARGKPITINGQGAVIPQEFGPTHNAIPVQVCNGEGSVAVSPEWVDPNAVITIHSPWQRPAIHYPPSGRLVTRHRARPGELCEKQKEVDKSEFWNLVHLCEVSNYHFVK